MQLPTSTPQSSAGHKAEDVRRETQVGADGRAVVELGHPAGGEVWYVERMIIQAPASAPNTCTAFVYAGQLAPADLLDASSDASLDIADNSRPWLIDNAPLLVVFAGAVPDTLVYVRAQITKVRP